MPRNLPPPSGQTIVTEVLQRSDVCFYWNMMHKQLTAAKLTGSIGDRLQSTVPIRKHRFVDEQNNRITDSAPLRKSLASSPNKPSGNKKLGKTDRSRRITKPQSRRREPEYRGDRVERLILICFVLALLLFAVITHLFFKGDTVVTGLVTTLLSELSLFIGYYFGRRKQ